MQPLFFKVKLKKVVKVKQKVETEQETDDEGTGFTNDDIDDIVNF